VHSKVPRFGPGGSYSHTHVMVKEPKYCPHCARKWRGIPQRILVGKKYACSICFGIVVIPRGGKDGDNLL
jgi:hypothetical protein